MVRSDKSIDYSEQAWNRLKAVHRSPGRTSGHVRHFDYVECVFKLMPIPNFRSKIPPLTKKQLDKVLPGNAALVLKVGWEARGAQRVKRSA